MSVPSRRSPADHDVHAAASEAGTRSERSAPGFAGSSVSASMAMFGVLFADPSARENVVTDGDGVDPDDALLTSPFAERYLISVGLKANVIKQRRAEGRGPRRPWSGGGHGAWLA